MWMSSQFLAPIFATPGKDFPVLNEWERGEPCSQSGLGDQNCLLWRESIAGRPGRNEPLY